MASDTYHRQDFHLKLVMPYCDTHLRNQLITSNLKINSFEIRDAIGFDNDWLVSLRFFFECCSKPEYKGLSRLLDQANEHNQLVAAIENDIQNTIDFCPEKSAIVALNEVITTFFQTKQKILQAIQKYSVLGNDYSKDSIENYMGIVSSPLLDEHTDRMYDNLIQKSLQLATSAQIDGEH